MALVRSQAPLRRVLAAVAARLLEARGWERLGFARLDDYGRERLGLSARQLHELAHLHGALDERPALEAALVSGALSWTKVRLLARTATREDEARWVALARTLTTAELAREVRAVDRAARGADPGGAGPGAASPDAEAEPRENVVLRCTPEARARWYRVRQLAQRVAGERLAAWQCAEAAMAELLASAEVPAPAPSEVRPPCAGAAAPPAEPRAGRARDPSAHTMLPDADRTPSGPASRGMEPTRSAATPWGMEPTRSGPAPRAVVRLPGFLAAFLEGLGAADPFEVDARLRRLLRLEQSSQARLGRLLRGVASVRGYRDHGCRSMDEFAREHLGMSPRSVAVLLRIERACAGSPELHRAWHEAALSVEQARLLSSLADASEARHFASRWVEHARQVSVRRLADDVERALAARCFDPTGLATRTAWDRPEPAAGVPAGLHTRAQARAPRERVRLFFNAPVDVARLFRATLAAVQRSIERRERRVATQSEALERLFDVALEAWSVLQDRTARAHRVFERDGWRCTVPGCSSFRELHDHHVRFRAAGGSDALENRTTLCAWHHLRGVHQGRVGCRGTAPDGLEFTLGLRPGRAPLLRYHGGTERSWPVGRAAEHRGPQHQRTRTR